MNANQLKTIKDLDDQLDRKLARLKSQKTKKAAQIIAEMNEHRKWQKEELAKEGESYLYAYGNAIKQMILDSDVFIKEGDKI